MVVVFLDELVDEAAVVKVIPLLTNQVNRWLECQKAIDGMLASLENARAEDTVNLWQL